MLPHHVPHISMLFWTWATFFIAAAISFLIQVNLSGDTLTFSSFIKHCFPNEIWTRKSAWIDIVMYFGSKLINKLPMSFELACTTGMSMLTIRSMNLLMPHHVAFRVDYTSTILCSIVVFVVVDFSNYLTHYLQHFVPALWELHKVHHSATSLSPFTTERMHPFGNIFDSLVAAILVGIPVGMFGFLFNFDFANILLLLANANMIGTIIVLDALRHSHFPISFGPLDRVLLSPHMHQLHHSYKVEHWDKNFGNKLSIWDWFFGTVVIPRKEEEVPVGLGKPEEQEYNQIFGVYIGPLIKISRLVMGNVYTEKEQDKSFFARVLWRSPRQSAILQQQSTIATVGAPTNDTMIL